MARLQIKARLLDRDEIAFGPGKADLLDAIREHGSIAAAARAMGMSYRRAWLLVDVMNRCFRLPLVASGRGGAARGGAALTPLGERTLSRYRMMEKAVEAAAAPHWKAMARDLVR